MQIKIRSKKNVQTIMVDHITEHNGIRYAQRVEYPNIRTFVKLPKSTWQEVKNERSIESSLKNKLKRDQKSENLERIPEQKMFHLSEDFSFQLCH